VEPGTFLVIAVAAYVVIAALNGLGEARRRHRCGARVGLLGSCSKFVADGATRCSKHTGMPKKRWP
jgi:hypothetical protein